MTNTFTDVAVRGSGDDATLYLCDASGKVHVSRQSGREGSWTHSTPGSGAAIVALADNGERAVLVDDGGALLETTDGSEWSELSGPEREFSPTDVTLTESGTVVLADDGGALLAGTDGNWERETPAEQALYDVEVGNCGCVHAVGASGTVVHRMGHGAPGLTTLARWFDWWETATPTGQNLQAIAVGPPHVAVGASGTILER